MVFLLQSSLRAAILAKQSLPRRGDCFVRKITFLAMTEMLNKIAQQVGLLDEEETYIR